MIARIALAVIMLAGVAHADESNPKTAVAQQRLDAGTQAFKAKDFAKASTEFAAGYAAEPWSGFLFAWAQSERLRGDCPAALKLYTRFIATTPPDAVRQLAEDGVAACGGTVAVEPKPDPKPDPKPEPKPDLVAPGPGPAGDQTRRFPTPDEPHGNKLAFTLGGTAFVAGATSLLFYLSSRTAEKAAARATTHPDAVDLYDRAKSRRLGAQIAGGLGALLAAATVIRFTVHRKPATIALSGSSVTFVARF